jgi:hypothetical protein
MVIIVAFFKNKPPTPPSGAANVPKEEFLKSIKDLFKN